MKDKRLIVPVTALFAMIAMLVCYKVDTYIHPPPAHASSQFASIVCDGFKPVSSASSVQIITSGANSFVYICSTGFGSIGGSTWSMVEGTGATCATNTLAVMGGTTAATGYGLAVNGTYNQGSGQGAIAKTAVAGDNVCLVIAGTGPLAGVVSYTFSPF